MRTFFTNALVTTTFLSFLAGPVLGAVFNVNESSSIITLSGNSLGFALEEQSAGSLTTHFAGTINAALSESSIEFTGSSLITPRNNGSWEPKANGEPGSDPANFGGKASGGVLGSVVAAVRNAQIDVKSPLLTVTAGEFSSASLLFQMLTNSSGSLDYNLSGFFAKKGSIALAGLGTNRVTSLATISTTGNTQTLRIPLNADFYFKLVSANDTVLTVTGEIVATRSLAPPNDLFANRTVLTGTDLDISSSNIGAGSEAGEPLHAGKIGGKSVWWKWTPTVTGPAQLSTAGSNFDTLLAVYTGTFANLTAVASNDSLLGDTLTFLALSGTEYQIAVDGSAGAEGTFPLSLKQSVPTPLSSSSFDFDLDFWSVVSFPHAGPFDAPVGGPFTPEYRAANGNPGGYITQTDPDLNTWFWDAPPKLLGDQTLAYGGTLHFDLRLLNPGQLPAPFLRQAQLPAVDVVLAGPGNTLVFDLSPDPTDAWTSYSIPLLESAGWKKESLSGPAPTEAEFKTVLQSLSALRIRGEFRPDGASDLDNVSWAAPLERPALSIASAAGELKLSWPASAAAFHLLQSSTVGPGAQWAEVTAQPTVEEGQFVVRFAPGGASLFYILSTVGGGE